MSWSEGKKDNKNNKTFTRKSIGSSVHVDAENQENINRI